MERSIPKLSVSEFTQKLAKERHIAFGGEYTQDELQIVNEIANISETALLDEVQKEGKTGFMIAVAHNGKAAILIQIGEINYQDDEYGVDGKRLKYADYARAKVNFLQKNISCSRSSQGATEVYVATSIRVDPMVGGAVAFDNGFIIGISGLSSNAAVDEEASIKLGSLLGFKERG